MKKKTLPAAAIAVNVAKRFDVWDVIPLRILSIIWGLAWSIILIPKQLINIWAESAFTSFDFFRESLIVRYLYTAQMCISDVSYVLFEFKTDHHYIEHRLINIYKRRKSEEFVTRSSSSSSSRISECLIRVVINNGSFVEETSQQCVLSLRRRRRSK